MLRFSAKQCEPYKFSVPDTPELAAGYSFNNQVERYSSDWISVQQQSAFPISSKCGQRLDTIINNYSEQMWTGHTISHLCSRVRLMVKRTCNYNLQIQTCARGGRNTQEDSLRHLEHGCIYRRDSAVYMPEGSSSL